MSYAYLDQYEILHFVPEESEANRFAKDGKYVSTDIANAEGFPTKSDGKGGHLLR